MDLLYVALIVAFAAAMFGFVVVCDRVERRVEKRA